MKPGTTAQSLRYLVFAALVIAAGLTSTSVAQPTAPTVGDEHDHAAPSVRKRVEPVTLGAGQQFAADPLRAAAIARIDTSIACVCANQGQVAIDTVHSLADPACTCRYAARVRADLRDALAPLATAALADKRQVAEQLEAAFVPIAPEYERVWRYPAADYAWWLDDVRCVCDGCKPTIFFSKCQLSCSPAIVYKLRARIFFALGFSRDELLAYYLAEFNAGKPPREQQTQHWLLPRKQREQGWLVPLLLITLAIGGLVFTTKAWARRTRAAAVPPIGRDLSAAQGGVQAGGPAGDQAAAPIAETVAPEPTVDPRLRRLRAEVQNDDEAW